MDGSGGGLIGELLFRLPGGGRALARLTERVRRAQLARIEQHASMEVGARLLRMAEAPWFLAMDEDDQMRAGRVIAHLAAAAERACFEEAGIVRRDLLENTLDSLLPPAGRFSLVFEDLRFEGAGDDGRPTSLIAGRRLGPCALALNRRAVAAGDEAMGGHAERLTERVALGTLVHEVNHLLSAVPPGPTYAAFLDEYRAWLVGFVAYSARLPRRGEALRWIRQLQTDPAYPDIQQAMAAGTDESARILRFIESLGREEDLPAPLPDPRGNLSNP